MSKRISKRRNNRKLIGLSTFAAIPSAVKSMGKFLNKYGFSFSGKKFMSNFRSKSSAPKSNKRSNRVNNNSNKGGARKLLQEYDMQISEAPKQGYTLEYDTAIIAGKMLYEDSQSTVGVDYQYYTIGKDATIDDAVVSSTNKITPGTMQSIYLTDVTTTPSRSHYLFTPDSTSVTNELDTIRSKYKYYMVTGVTVEFSPQYSIGKFQSLTPFYIKAGAESAYSIEDLTNVRPLSLNARQTQVISFPFSREGREDVNDIQNQWRLFLNASATAQLDIMTRLQPLRLDMIFPLFQMDGQSDTRYQHAGQSWNDAVIVLYHIKVKVHILAAVPKPVSLRMMDYRIAQKLLDQDPQLYESIKNNVIIDRNNSSYRNFLNVKYKTTPIQQEVIAIEEKADEDDESHDSIHLEE